MSATEYTDEDILAVSDALRDWDDDWSGTASRAEAVLDAVAPAIVARERRRADAYEAALTEERAMAHETIRALQAEVAHAKADALREAADHLQSPAGIATVLHHGSVVEGPGERVEAAIPLPPRRPVDFEPEWEIGGWLRDRADEIERAATEARS